MRYVNIAVDAPIPNTFDYHVPPELEHMLEPGHLVQVPFGTALQHGIVLSLHDDTPIEKTKPVHSLIDPRPLLTRNQIEVARWMSKATLAPIGLCLWLWLPPGLTGHQDIEITLIDENAEYSGKPAIESPLESEIVALVKRRRTVRGTHLNQAFHGQNWRAAVDGLVSAGVLRKRSVLSPPRVKPKIVQTAALAIHPNEIAEHVSGLGVTSKAADLLEYIAAHDGADAKTALKAAGATAKHQDALAADGLIIPQNGSLLLGVPRVDVSAWVNRLRKLEKPLRILSILAREGDAIDVSWIYAQADAGLADLKKLEDEGLVLLAEKQKWRDSMAERAFVSRTAPLLTPEQAAVWQVVEKALEPAAPESGKTFLLHGVTGSGKTEIYLRAVETVLSQERTAILLVPEIALTAQTVRRVAARFPGKVGVIHSRLSEGERYDTWRRARDGLVRVIVGARSALFTPLPNVGLIILDECHDDSYKQSPPVQPPYYHARDAAEAIIQQQGGVLILGSATPDIESAYRAARGEIRLLEMPRRILGHKIRIGELGEKTGVAPRYQPDPAQSDDAMTIDLPPVRVVDMRDELKAGNTSIFSRPLQAALADVLKRREQAILFLNRRGQATYVFCRDCGYVANCPRCDTPLTHHRAGEVLRCHRCGFSQTEPTHCPQCASKRIKFFGAGTQQVEMTLAEMFPLARIARWDADTAASPEAHEAILQRFIDRKTDVMIGTQMVAKGLDLPLVTLVGVVSADVGINLPDFRAGERAFQVLTQVAGRAGRGLLGGAVILQTYRPEHYAIQAAARHDFKGFYDQEIAYRREMGYPPFRSFVRVLFRFPTAMQAQAEAERAANMIRHRLKILNMSGTELIGPAPCFFERENKMFRWHLLLRGPDPTAALRDLNLPRGWHIDVDPVDVL
ncbi:MAG: primosomal protein N' [bacterium]|nr:primosomal protein N' [bacterium]